MFFRDFTETIEKRAMQGEINLQTKKFVREKEQRLSDRSDTGVRLKMDSFGVTVIKRISAA